MVKREKRVVTDVPEEWVVELDEAAEFAGKARADVLRDAIREYLDRDRMARIEDEIAAINDRLDELDGADSSQAEHTHTNAKTSKTVQRTREIARRLYDNHGTYIDESDVERAITDIAGGHDRTLSKYKDELEDRGLLYRHPNDDVQQWYAERSAWASEAVAKTIRQYPNPLAKLQQITEEYSLELPELREESDELDRVIQQAES